MSYSHELDEIKKNLVNNVDSNGLGGLAYLAITSVHELARLYTPQAIKNAKHNRNIILNDLPDSCENPLDTLAKFKALGWQHSES